MRKIMLAVLAATLSLSFTGTAPAESNSKTTPAQSTGQAGKKVTIEELGEMLETQGYKPKAIRNKEGTLLGYAIVLTRGSTKIDTVVSIDPDGSGINYSVFNLLQFSDAQPATSELLLGLLAEQHRLSPAYLAYYPATRTLGMTMTTPNQNVTPASLQSSLNTVLDKFAVLHETYAKLKVKG